MEKTLLLLFLILFLGRIIWRYILQQLNIRNLRNHGKEIPPIFQCVIDEATLVKMVDYTYDNSRLETKENLAGDIIELAILFLLLPVLVGKLAGLQLQLIWQALIFFGCWRQSAVLPEFPSIFTILLFWKRNMVFPPSPGASGLPT